jgi:hypothetical protein
MPASRDPAPCEQALLKQGILLTSGEKVRPACCLFIPLTLKTLVTVALYPKLRPVDRKRVMVGPALEPGRKSFLSLLTFLSTSLTDQGGCHRASQTQHLLLICDG